LDLINCYSEAIGPDSGFDIYQWKKEWLDQAGLNSLEVTKIKHKAGNKSDITVV